MDLSQLHKKLKGYLPDPGFAKCTDVLAKLVKVLYALALELCIDVVLASGAHVNLTIQRLWLVESEYCLHDTLYIAGLKYRFIAGRQLINQHELWIGFTRSEFLL